MKSQAVFSKKDLTIVTASILLVIMNIGAINKTGRRRAKEMVCLSNLRQWGVVFEMYTQDNNGNFFNGRGSGSGLWWIELLEPYYKDTKLLRCPETAEPLRAGIAQTRFRAWKSSNYIGSYGPNGWICNPHLSSLWGRGPISDYWRRPGIRGLTNIPVFSDMWYVDAWPRYFDVPPMSDGPPLDRTNVDEMKRVCVNRHNAALNILFMDWSARKVGLKELWTLKWHRSFNTEGPWTKAGGVQPGDWPQWMRNFKEY